jgi:RNA 2',3'-cyclic 3'-phosphodiesterase
VRVRLFIAVMPSEAAVEHLDDEVGRLRRLRRIDADVRWVPSYQWHITLVFLGEVEPDVADELVPVLDDVMAHCPRPTLQLSGVGTFGSKVLFAGVVDPATGFGSHALEELAVRTREVVASRGLAVESREFRPHLTLARARGGRGSFAQVEKGLLPYQGPAWEVRDVVLVQSESVARGDGPGVVHRQLSTSLVGPTG